ncbi:unknown [[Mannheimia] succiniciproducens MBEL55E]|uniref:Uncharacterized protein n=1 Tax=Mannheimia succiniciproducens (strain KCTC 0769BP / MBEL55E) TaxID=221988 RepID=Q65W04_MANSM|nr:unknown [[Mannheimia] succiniciproducens MBEL55E]
MKDFQKIYGIITKKTFFLSIYTLNIVNYKVAITHNSVEEEKLC